MLVNIHVTSNSHVDIWGSRIHIVQFKYIENFIVEGPHFGIMARSLVCHSDQYIRANHCRGIDLRVHLQHLSTEEQLLHVEGHHRQYNFGQPCRYQYVTINPKAFVYISLEDMNQIWTYPHRILPTCPNVGRFCKIESHSGGFINSVQLLLS